MKAQHVVVGGWLKVERDRLKVLIRSADPAGGGQLTHDMWPSAARLLAAGLRNGSVTRIRIEDGHRTSTHMLDAQARIAFAAALEAMADEVVSCADPRQGVLFAGSPTRN
jgi:hypothetical protein